MKAPWRQCGGGGGGGPRGDGGGGGDGVGPYGDGGCDGGGGGCPRGDGDGGGLMFTVVGWMVGWLMVGCLAFFSAQVAGKTTM